MTEINYAELKYIILKKDGANAWKNVERLLPTLPVKFHPAVRELSDLAADFKSRFTISLADAYAAALAKHRNAILVTGDLEFKPLEREVKIDWLPRRSFEP